MPRESDIHPHKPEELATLFTADDAGSTEHEYLELLGSLVRALKPRRVLETGTWEGCGSVALAKALAANKRGVLVCVDTDQAALDRAKKRIFAIPNAAGLPTFVQSHSLDFIAEYAGEPFDFAFLDSDLSVRGYELDLLLRRGLLTKGATVCIHDTSLSRTWPDGTRDTRTADLKAMLDTMVGEKRVLLTLDFPLSRGLTLVRV